MLQLALSIHSLPTNYLPSHLQLLIMCRYAALAGGYERVAVIDFDVHHGNGTQEVSIQ